MRSIAAIVLLSTFAASIASGDEVNGQWSAASSGVVLELKSDGARLTGWLSQPNGRLEIKNGWVQGNGISFEMAMEVRGQAHMVFCTGKLEGGELHLVLRPDGQPSEDRITLKRVYPDAPLDRFSEGPAPPELAPWLKANAITLASVQLDASLADLAPLKAHLLNARVVAMGEATHGTREFQQLKIRMFRFLVEQLGFTVFGIEANWPESLAVNDYVLGGSGDPERALGFIALQTEDMLALLRWMRQYNQDPTHTRKLKFYGFDMQMPGLAEANVLGYLRRVDPEVQDTAAKIFGLLGYGAANEAYEAATTEVKHRTADTLAMLLRRFDDRRPEYIRNSSDQEWKIARQNLVIVIQAEVKLRNQNERGRTFRDQAMAENVKWILDQEPPGTKMMLWAHNAHVAAAAGLDAPDHLPMGGHLRRFFPGQVISCGFAFKEGSFAAVDMTMNQLRTFTVGPPPRGTLDATLAAVEMPLFAIDLHRIPAGRIADWFESPHYSRQIGGGYSEATPGVWMHRINAPHDFDFLIFVARTTSSR